MDREVKLKVYGDDPAGILEVLEAIREIYSPRITQSDLKRSNPNGYHALPGGTAMSSDLYRFNGDDASKFYQFISHNRPGEHTEIRAIEWRPNGKQGRCITRFVDNEADFIKWCQTYTEDPQFRGKFHVYAGVNPRRSGVGSGNDGSGTAKDVSRITCIPFDLDLPDSIKNRRNDVPEGHRSKDLSATDEEISIIYAGLDQFTRWQGKHCEKNSLYIGSSGNGFHVIRSVDIPIDETIANKLRAYAYEAKAISTTVDSIFDLPRIIKVPGTWSVKGPHLPDRPHRRAYIRKISGNTPDPKLMAYISNIPVTTKNKVTPATYNQKVNNLRPCFKRFIEHGDRVSTREDRLDETSMRFALVEEAHANGFTVNETVALFTKADDFDRDKTLTEVTKKFDEIKTRGSRPYRCITIHTKGACLGPDCLFYQRNIIDREKTKKEKAVFDKIAESVKNNIPPDMGVKNKNLVSKLKEIVEKNKDNQHIISKSNYSKKPENELGGNIFKNSPLPRGHILSIAQLDKALTCTIKHDYNNKIVLFLITLLNYTEEDQQNVALTGPSAGGKSHLALELAKLHVREHIMKLGYTSPKAFFHDLGVLVDPETGDPIPDKKEYVNEVVFDWVKNNPKPTEHGEKGSWTEERDNIKDKAGTFWNQLPKIKRIDLHQMIIIFVDQPHDQLLQHLRAMLSHDDKIIRVKITDKSSSGKNQTMNTELVGYPTIIFNSTNFMLDPQEQSRVWLMSPEISQDKYQDTINYIAKYHGNRRKFKSELSAKELRNRLIEHVSYISHAGINQIIVDPDDLAYLIAKFSERNPTLTPRHQRDFPRLIAICKAFALFRITERVIDENQDLYALRADIEDGLELYQTVAESNEKGLPPHIWKLFNDKMVPVMENGNGVSRRVMSRMYFELFNTPLGSKAQKSVISLLTDVGLCIEEKDPFDKRTKMLFLSNVEPLDLSVIPFAVKYLKNNGKRTTIANMIEALQDEGYEAKDFKTLEKFKDKLAIDGAYIMLSGGSKSE